jgi:serine/threonine protein kinase
MTQWATVRSSDYATFAYDAMFTWIKALQIYLKKGNRLEFINMKNESASMKLKKIMENITFHGVSGIVKFQGNNRISSFSVSNFVGGELHLIGDYNSNSKEVNINKSLVWGKCCAISTTIPPDQNDEVELGHRHDCLGLESLAETLGECASAVALVFSTGFCGLLVLLIILFIMYYRRFAGTKQRMQELGLMENYKRSSALLLVDAFEIPRSKLQLNRKLGEGCFGHVYGGEAIGVVPGKDKTPVAVKTLRPEAEPVDKLLFLEEVQIMKQLEHSNIVSLIGVCTKNEPIFAVMELMVYGDLQSYLLSHRHCLLSQDLFRMAVDVGKGVQYMHSAMYIHRDIASRNCMVTLNRVTKLGDFGMTRKIDDPSDYYKYQKKGFLPVRWMAPESLSQGVFSFASDVWSFGVLLYEIITVAGFPYQGLSNFEVVEKVPKGLTISLPRLCPEQFSTLVRRCWCFNSELRPSIDDVLSTMERTDPLQLFTPCTDARPEIISTSDDYPDSGTGRSKLPKSGVLENSKRSFIRRYSQDILSRNVSSVKRRPSTVSADAISQSACSALSSFKASLKTPIPNTPSLRQEIIKESSV